MFGRKVRYPLPKFPPDIAPTFDALCREIPEPEIAELGRAVQKRIKDLRKRATVSGLVDLRLADAVAEKCAFLLNSYDQQNSPGKCLITGAVSYFALEDDPIPDESFASGLFDDAKVINHVLERLGIEGQFINLEE